MDKQKDAATEKYLRYGYSNDIKERIIENARTKFGKYGYSNVKTDDLAKEIGISKRTLYEIFPSKNSLFEEVISNTLLGIKKTLDELMIEIKKPESEFLEILLDMWNMNYRVLSIFSPEFFAEIKTKFPFIYQRFLDFREEQMKVNFNSIFQLGIDRGIFKNEIN